MSTMYRRTPYFFFEKRDDMNMAKSGIQPKPSSSIIQSPENGFIGITEAISSPVKG